MLKFWLTNLLLFSAVMAFSPAKPGIIPSAKVIQQAAIMAESYTQGGLVAKMQRVKTANIQLAQTGNREQREDIYMGYPIIMGSYSDYNDLDTTIQLLQRELFDGPWSTITMAEHYGQMSYGQFHLSGTVYGWYEMANNSDYYEGSQIPGNYDNGLNVGDFLFESLTQADVEVDFAQYDNDGPDGVANSGDDDGFVDAVAFVHSGPGGEGGGSYVWSHRWRYNAWWGLAFATNDMGANGSFIRVNDYTIQPAVAVNGSNLIEIGVFSHEFGHALGLPDLYDTDYSSDGVGSWCLMASGSWSSPSSPTHMSAWCKEMIGWIVPRRLDLNMNSMAFPNAEENAFALKLWTHGEVESYTSTYSHAQNVGREYFLIENRQRMGSETHLPGTGLLIWHIDNSRSNNDNENHRMVDVKAADNYINGSSSGDPWPGTTNNRNFDFNTTPSSIGWQGINTEVALLNVSDSDSTMTADVEIHESAPHITIEDVIISDSNDDHIYSPGETVLIWLAVKNSGALVTNLEATLSVNDNHVDVVGDLISFDPIEFMGLSTSSEPFEFIISDSLSPHQVTFDVTFTAEGSLEPDHHDVLLMLGLPEITLIDDDGALAGADDFQAYYTDALLLAGKVFSVWDIAESGAPDLEWLQRHSSVIWYSGNKATPLDANKIDLLSTYLNEGGHLIMSGQELGNGDESVALFLSDYFAVEVLPEEISSIYVYGDPTHEFYDVLDRYSIRNAVGANNQSTPDAFHILQGGYSTFTYPFVGNASCGSSVKNQTYSAVILGFGMEALAPFSGDADMARGDLIQRLITWMETPTTAIRESIINLPERVGIISTYPNPFNPQIHLDIQLHDGLSGELQIIDLRGALVASLDVTKSGVVEWQPTNRVAGGVYFIRLLVNGEITGRLDKITYLK